MNANYDIDLRLWEVTNGHITVRGPEREGCEERLLELERRLKEAEEERLALLRESSSMEEFHKKYNRLLDESLFSK
jgi:hypothetical protein